jgi:predicted short-subunit dehydrogenase-like oxidoreductase (DUF2520 family)
MPVSPLAKNDVARPADSVCVIGLGNWGTSLAHALAAHGLLRDAVVRSRRTGRSKLPIRSWNAARLDARILWLCVPDDTVALVCREIVARRKDLTRQIVLHSSGALPASVLAPAQSAGAAIASVHPVMSFPRREIVPLAGVLFGIETGERAALARIRKLVQAIGGRPFAIKPGSKALYHAAGTLASPLLVSLVAAAERTARLAGLNPQDASKMVAALAQATVSNVAAKGAAASFSGPFARGDAGTIELHLQALQPHPVLAQTYRALAANALGELPVKQKQQIEALLHQAPGRKPSKRTSQRRRAQSGGDKL